MIRPVYIRSLARIRPGDPEPDCSALLRPLEARRMGRLLKRAIWTSHEALSAAGVDMPDAIITATDFGCVENSASYLRALIGLEDAPLRPTHFMQSTHNTIGSLIAIRLGCHGYNATYSHRGNSLESALEDASLQISLGDIDTALVGWYDELIPELEQMLRERGEVPEEHALALVLGSKPEGALAEYTLENLRALCGN